VSGNVRSIRLAGGHRAARSPHSVGLGGSGRIVGTVQEQHRWLTKCSGGGLGWGGVGGVTWNRAVGRSTPHASGAENCGHPRLEVTPARSSSAVAAQRSARDRTMATTSGSIPRALGNWATRRSGATSRPVRLLACRLRAVVEYVPEVAGTAPADNLGADHPVGMIRAQLDGGGHRRSVKLGQPVPESNFASELNGSAPHPAHRNTPRSLLVAYSWLKGRSVPCSRSTWYCSGLSSSRHCSSVSPRSNAVPPRSSTIMPSCWSRRA
jgi:hypothetical protein